MYAHGYTRLYTCVYVQALEKKLRDLRTKMGTLERTVEEKEEMLREKKAAVVGLEVRLRTAEKGKLYLQEQVYSFVHSDIRYIH